MTLKKTSKQIVIGALAVSLIAGSGMAIPGNSVAAAAALTTPFTDISIGHWAEKHIAKLALQGIIEGYSAAGNTYIFSPNKSVSQEEAVLMALRFAGLANKVDKNSSVGFPDSFKVSNYFKSYILLAFQEGLLDQSEEYDLASKNTKVAWGTKPASREWVTKLMVRAIGKDSEAVSMQNAASTFSDAAQVNSLYKGYVNLASKLELVKGVTTVKFDPKADVNRASLATMFSRAQKLYPVNYEGQTSGIVSRITDTSLTVYSDKKETTYAIGSDTLYYHYNSETPITKQQLLEYGDITVIAKDGKALYVEVQGDKAYSKTWTGTLDRVIPSEKKLYVWVDNKPVEVNYNDSLVVVDTEGKAIALNAIKRDSQISIVQDTFRETPMALKIIASAQSNSTVAAGTFYGTDGELITIKEGANLLSKFMANTVTVEINGIAAASISDLIKEADEVELTLNADDKVTKIKVTNRNAKSLAGAQIISFVYDKKLLTIVDANGANAQALYFNDRTKIEYSGNAISLSSAASLLTQNRKIVITYTGNSIVSLQFVTKYVGTLVSLNSVSNLITLKIDGGANVSLPYNAAYVEVAGLTNASFSDLKVGELLTLELNANQDRVSTIKANRNIQYEVISIDTINKRLRVKNNTTAAFDLPVLNSELINEAGAKLTIEQILPGTIVDATYLGTQATTVKTVDVTFGRIQSVSKNSVAIMNIAGQSIVYNEDKGFVINKGTTQGADTSLLTVGDYVEVIKTNDNKIQFTAAVGESRVFTSYDANAGQIWTEKVTSSDNRNYFNVTSSTKYTQGGNAILISNFKAGDAITVYSFRNNAVAIVKQ
ncbi:hypothetical protein FHS15_002804 [Paenibacillus castaneae]|uniref:S-layer homology domain-containing protein n=1 Tax=Paenibacillus castaneae TaxID=474957 RepID=UPI000C9CC645|nr:S-layer homology domain-containing protein [Paenibacillus castaneae]NIK77668.1 hypothetical protein [Paenibacillus castaneae]